MTEGLGARLTRTLSNSIKARVFSGLVLALPIAITFWVIYQLFSTLQGIVLDPIALLIDRLTLGRASTVGLPFWWTRIVAPLIAICAVLAFLYVLGYFVRTRVAWLIDWVMTHLPGVAIIYQAIRNVFLSLETQRQDNQHQRIVLVPFPHPGMRALALVTKSLRDADTQKTILCVYVMTAVVPPAGFTLFVPEEEVTDVDWTTNETFQLIFSGGMTAPGIIRYHGGPTKLIIPGHAPGEEAVGSAEAE
jgi:uncharacterized membrane protein